MDAINDDTTINLRDVVREAMDACGWSRKDTATYLRAIHDPNINDAFRALGIDQAIRNFQTDERHGASDKPGAPTPKPIRLRVSHDPEAIQARADMRLARRMWWDRATLFGGDLLLGDATRKDLKTSAKCFGKHEQGNRNMRLFHEDLANRMKDDQTKVRNFFRVEKIIERAKAHGIL